MRRRRASGQLFLFTLLGFSCAAAAQPTDGYFLDEHSFGKVANGAAPTVKVQMSSADDLGMFAVRSDNRKAVTNQGAQVSDGAGRRPGVESRATDALRIRVSASGSRPDVKPMADNKHIFCPGVAAQVVITGQFRAALSYRAKPNSFIGLVG